MMDRGQAHGSRAIQTAQDHTHPTIHLDGLSGQGEAYRAAGPGKLRLAAHVAGTLMSLAVIGFGGFWGYKQIMRDVHGVPVVRALDGPMRIAPEDPGGQVASHAGLAVNTVQAVGSASAPEDRLTLAPQPIGLAEEDQPVGKLVVVPAASQDTVLGNRSEADDADILPADTRPQTASLSQETPDEDPIARALALAEASTAGARPLSATEVTGADETADTAAPDPADAQAAPAPVVTGPWRCAISATTGASGASPRGQCSGRERRCCGAGGHLRSAERDEGVCRANRHAAGSAWCI